MMCAGNATPGSVNCPPNEFYMSSHGLVFNSCLVVLQDESWAILYLITNKTHKLNKAIASTQVYISHLSTNTFFLFSSGINTPIAS